jgi:hypothetical protein
MSIALPLAGKLALTISPHKGGMRYAIALASIVALSACVGPPEGHRPTPHVAAPNPSASLRQCLGGLSALGARYTILPDHDYGGGCSAINAVMLTGAGVPVSNVTAIQCPLARALTAWVRSSVQPAAREAFGQSIARIETMGAYSCRNIIGGKATGLSEHASANAVDVSAFVLADGRRITIRAGWRGAEDEQAFLRSVRKAACQRFQTVLSPDYNAAHYNHLHFDMGRGPFCR